MENKEYFERMYKLRGTEIKQLKQSHSDQMGNLKGHSQKQAKEIHKLRAEVKKLKDQISNQKASVKEGDKKKTPA